MPANLVRCQYDDVERIAAQFIRESNETEGTVRVIRQAVDILRDGGWLGEGARAFYEEMDEYVFKNLDRLVNALNTAEQRVREAIAKLHETEDQQSNKWKQLEATMQRYTRSR
jgi:WXG100 family type VII secretion target